MSKKERFVLRGKVTIVELSVRGQKALLFYFRGFGESVHHGGNMRKSKLLASDGREVEQGRDEHPTVLFWPHLQLDPSYLIP